MQYRIAGPWRVGISLQTPSVGLSGSGKFVAHEVIRGTGHDQAIYVENLDTRNAIPMSLSAGIGCEIPKSFSAGLSLAYHLPNSFTSLSGQDQTGTYHELVVHNVPVLDINVGGEYYLADGYPVRLGFFSSFSSSPDPDLSAPGGYQSQVDLYGLTASVGRETDHVRTTLGMNWLWGQGTDYGWIVVDGDTIQAEVDASETHLYVFLNTAYLF